jgi:hypothetical protein
MESQFSGHATHKNNQMCDVVSHSAEINHDFKYFLRAVTCTLSITLRDKMQQPKRAIIHYAHTVCGWLARQRE